MSSFVRIQVQLTEEQARALKVRARNEERSMADLVRESVSEYLARRPAWNHGDLLERANTMTGRFHSGSSDIAINHDRYLDEAYDS